MIYTTEQLVERYVLRRRGAVTIRRAMADLDMTARQVRYALEKLEARRVVTRARAAANRAWEYTPVPAKEKRKAK